MRIKLIAPRQTMTEKIIKVLQTGECDDMKIVAEMARLYPNAVFFKTNEKGTIEFDAKDALIAEKESINFLPA